MPNEEAISISLTFRRMFQTTGFPKHIITDQGQNLVSKLFSDLCLRLGIECSYTTSYHPMANGEVERTHQTIIKQMKTSMMETRRVG